MKNLLSILLITVFSLTSYGQAKISIDKKTHKFPVTKEGTMLTHTYKLTNTGDQPLILAKYEVACPCTKLEYPKEPILPGKTVDLIVYFDTHGKIKWQDRIITLYSNAQNSPTKIRFKVMVDNSKDKE